MTVSGVLGCSPRTSARLRHVARQCCSVPQPLFDLRVVVFPARVPLVVVRDAISRESAALPLRKLDRAGRPIPSSSAALGHRHVLRNDVLSDVWARVNRFVCCSGHFHALTVAKSKFGSVLHSQLVQGVRHDAVLRDSWATPQSKGCGFSTCGRSPLRVSLLHGPASCRQGIPDPSFHIGAVIMQVHHPIVHVEHVYGAPILLELVLMCVGDEGRGSQRRPGSIKPHCPVGSIEHVMGEIPKYLPALHIRKIRCAPHAGPSHVDSLDEGNQTSS